MGLLWNPRITLQLPGPLQHTSSLCRCLNASCSILFADDLENKQPENKFHPLPPPLPTHQHHYLCNLSCYYRQTVLTPIWKTLGALGPILSYLLKAPLLQQLPPSLLYQLPPTASFSPAMNCLYVIHICVFVCCHTPYMLWHITLKTRMKESLYLMLTVII